MSPSATTRCCLATWAVLLTLLSRHIEGDALRLASRHVTRVASIAASSDLGASGTPRPVRPVRGLATAAPVVPATADAFAWHDSQPAPKRLPVLGGGYLFPILVNGPNNQVTGLKEALALGHLLNRTVITYDFLPNYNDAHKGGNLGWMDFNLLFDVDLLSRYHSIVSLEELKAGGWDGCLDIVAHFGRTRITETKRTLRNREPLMNVSAGEEAYFELGKMRCTPTYVAAWAQKLLPYKTVAFLLAETIVPRATYDLELRPTGDLCHDLYLQASAHLAKSRRIRDIARSFRQKRLGGAEAPYVAVHVRPFPDRCMLWWHGKEHNEEQARGICKNPKLYFVFVNDTLQQVRRLEKARSKGNVKLFVMSYPELRPMITAMYDKVGMQAEFYDIKDLQSELGYKPSISLWGFVEQEIAYESDVFIASTMSSMSATIVQERGARGKPLENTLVFTGKD